VLFRSINNLVLGQVGHHRLGDFIVGLRPQVDHLVVLLALGYQAGGILGFDFLHFVGGGIDDASLLVRNLEVIDADGHAGNRRIGKTGVHQLVGENHGVLQTNRAVRLVDQLGDRFFLHRLVDDVVGQAFRHDLEQQRTTNGGIYNASILDQRAVFLLDGFMDTNLDLGVQRRFTGAEHPIDLLQVGEHATV